MNIVEITGHLAKDPTIRATKTGKSVASFTVAVNRNYTTAQGEQRELTDWINIVAWGPLAEAAGNQLKKGTFVFIQGRYSTRSYEAQDGSRKYVTEVTAHMIAIPLNITSRQERRDFTQFGTPVQRVEQPELNEPFPEREEIPF